MSLVIACACGQKLKVRDEFAGKKAKCPKCGNVLTAPPPAEEEPAELLEMIQEEKPPAKPKRVRDLDDDAPDKDPDIKKRGASARDQIRSNVSGGHKGNPIPGLDILVGIVIGSVVGGLSGDDPLIGAGGGAVLGILIGTLGGILYRKIRGG